MENTIGQLTIESASLKMAEELTKLGIEHRIKIASTPGPCGMKIDLETKPKNAMEYYAVHGISRIGH